MDNSQTKQKDSHLILVLFSFILLIGLIFYITKNVDQLIQIKKVDSVFIIAITSVHALHFIFLGITHMLPLKKHNIKLNYKEWFGLCLISELFNIFLPAKGGTAIRMLYLKQNYNLGINTFLTMGFSIVVTSFTFLGIAGSIYCHYYLNKSEVFFTLFESVCISLSLSGILLITMSESISKIFNLKKNISSFFYFRDYRLIFKCTFLYLCMFALYPMRIFLSFKAIGEPIHFLDSLEIALVILVVSIFEILPGNIGIRELATAYIATHFGVKFETALIASLLDRAILFIFLVPTGSYFYSSLFEFNLQERLINLFKKSFAKKLQ